MKGMNIDLTFDQYQDLQDLISFDHMREEFLRHYLLIVATTEMTTAHDDI